MKMNDMIVISVDDHICEPPGMFRQHLKGDALASAPKLLTATDGSNFWEYQGMVMPTVGLSAVVGRPLDEYGFEPTSMDQLRKGVYDVDARIDDMNVNGVAVSLNFGTAFGFDGGRFHTAPNRELALVHLRAYNDWHIDEWCGAHPGRFIPCGVLPTWNMAATVEEIKRLARKGCRAVSLNESPTRHGLPSIHNAYWDPMWKAIVEHNFVMCLHMGGGHAPPHASMETPIEAWITTMPMSAAVGAADWLFLPALQRYPSMKIALSECGLGWVPYFMERVDLVHARHRAWTHSNFPGRKPSDVFRAHFLICFIEDAFGLRNLASVNEDMVAYECDYPHPDTTWPEVPERLWEALGPLNDQQIQKVTHGNAMRFFDFDPRRHYRHETLTVGALRAAAAAKRVDTLPRSSGGAAPLAADEAPRPVTSGDVMAMMSRYRKGDSKAV